MRFLKNVKKEGKEMKVFESSCKIKRLLSGRSNYSEQTLTEHFVDYISTRYRSHAYKLTQKYEGSHSGADFIWLVITEYGVFQFLVQAKKAVSKYPYISKKQALYNNGEQIKLLMKFAHENECVPFYFLYSNSINAFKCNTIKTTEEGVFIESAHHIYKYFTNEKSDLDPLPVSCLFSCLSKECKYTDENMDYPCLSCNCCDIIDKCCIFQNAASNANNTNGQCDYPFIPFLSYHYQLGYKPKNLNSNLLLSIFADSVLARNPLLVPFLFEDTDYPSAFIDRVVISDYLNRHGEHYLNTLIGDEYDYNDDVLTKEYIIEVIKRHWKECRFFCRIGIFGSYSRNEATKQSDVDIAIEYDYNKIKNANHLKHIIVFLSNVIKDLKKNVDFIDYISCKSNSNPHFINCINEDMIWIKKPYNIIRYNNRNNRYKQK